MRDALQLRHQLIPYIYTMAWRNTAEGISLMTPMYYDQPEGENAYHCLQQYRFGTELIVAPEPPAGAAAGRTLVQLLYRRTI